MCLAWTTGHSLGGGVLRGKFVQWIATPATPIKLKIVVRGMFLDTTTPPDAHPSCLPQHFFKQASCSL